MPDVSIAKVADRRPPHPRLFPLAARGRPGPRAESKSQIRSTTGFERPPEKFYTRGEQPGTRAANHKFTVPVLL
ncbi:hypothetical protein KL86PLE_90130 [uncultured Pleomorphomonas sp.]|uniref:Uncharacterized protein n=1 Tax=uncultured Pleomorphomonas sp. TaxID=442121 RepID=A0A212LMY9_9HYPH|nr:hypothetical protein KL86PLE_90130 [uncultured Pleomorphomonas sp.]